MTDLRGAAHDLLVDGEFDDLIAQWISEGEFDGAVVERAKKLLEKAVKQ